jgi:hypothetical protein
MTNVRGERIFSPEKLALTSPTGGGRSVAIVRSRTKATEFRVLVGYKIQDFREVFKGYATV